MYGWATAGIVGTVLGGMLWLSDHRLDKARTTIATHEQTIENFAETNKANLATIESLEAANAAWAVQWDEHSGNWNIKVTSLRNQLENERAARARDRAAANAELERILNEDITAAQWSDAPVPDSIADWLCKRPAVSCAGGSEGSEGPGADGT